MNAQQPPPSAYRALAAELGREGLFKPRDAYGYLTVAVETLLHALGFALLLLSRPLGVGYWVAELFLAVSMFRFFVILHECGHKSLFRTQRASTIAGVWASIFCLVPYTPWRSIHRLHHKWVGVIDKDPTQEALLRLKSYSASMNAFFRIIWKLWIPVMYFVFIFNVFWGYPFRQLAKGNRREAAQGFASVLACLVPKVAFVAYFGWKASLILLGPMVYAFLFIDENISLPQHTALFPYLSDDHPAPIPYGEQAAVTRTTHRPGVLAVLLAYNFNLHTEHHLFPSVPWYWLPKVTDRLARRSDYQRVNFDYMFSIRSRDPVEVYTRALPPHAPASVGGPSRGKPGEVSALLPNEDAS